MLRARLKFMYNRDLNYRAFFGMISSWLIMVVFWIASWYSNWVAALFGLLANVYFLVSLWFFWRLYPERRE